VETRYCALVWAINGAGGVPKEKGCFHKIVLMCAHKPRIETNILLRPTWHLHNIAIHNIVWHIFQYRVVDGKHILHNRVLDEGGKRGAQTQVECATNRIDLCTQASN